MKKLCSLVLTAVLLFCLSVSALAVAFTPSVEQKDAPQIVPITDSEGHKADAVITEEDGTETVVGEDPSLQIVITPYSKKDEAIVADITGYLDGAEYQIANAENVSELTDSMVSTLEEAKRLATDPLLKELTIDDLIVRDLFDVSLVRDKQFIEPLKDGQTITFSVQTDLKPGDLFFVLLNCSGEEWKVVKNIQIDENGVLTITVDSLCAIAILVDSMTLKPVAQNGPTSPQTGEISNNALWIGAVVFGAAAIFLFARADVEHKKQSETMPRHQK